MIQMMYYAGAFLLSFLLTLLYCFIWHKHFDVHMTLMFFLIPVVNLGYLLMYENHNPETAVAALKVVYFGGCLLPWLTMMCVIGLCRIRFSRALRLITLTLSSAVYLSVLSIGKTPLFYRSLTLERVGSVWVQQKVYGPFHMLHYACIICYLLVDLVAIVYSYRKKRQVSHRMLTLLFFPILTGVAGYFVNHALLSTGFELMPVTYVFAQIIYLLIAHRLVLYNVGEMVVESMVQSGETGFITVDAKGRYLGSNETAKNVLPELRQLTADQPVQSEPTLGKTVNSWLERFKEDPDSGRTLYVTGDDETEEDRFYTVMVNYLYDGKRRCGYQIFLEDDTRNQKYIRLLDRYNANLQAEVAAKTERIVAMHDKLILGMAAMVESRDNSTGGHIRRTSEGVRLLTEVMRDDGALGLSEDYCRALVKAAPMHDLGKIAVDDAVLRKAGAFTPEEREKMKQHAAEGARIVHSILADTDDEVFRAIAENMAHYHHERVDGSGYPDGLKGDEIPLEARIMAIADVYDALVSKRVYKEKFSFEKADRIILEGMGTQFDEQLKPYYLAARPRLEAYYAKESSN